MPDNQEELEEARIAEAAPEKVFTFDPAKEKSLTGETKEVATVSDVLETDTPAQTEPVPEAVSPAPTMPLDDPRIDGEGVNAILWVSGEEYPLGGCMGFVHYQDQRTHRRYFRLKDQSGNPKEYVNIGSNRNEGYQLASLLLAAGIEKGAFL